MTSTAGSDPLVSGVDDVLITDELASRPSRAPDYEAESRALGLLAQEMAANPRGVLQKCAELVMELCHADSAGISILEPGGTSGVLRWQAAAGGFAPHLHGTMPAEASPCGTVMERNCVLLFHEAERFFPDLRGVEPRIYENLLTPWHVEGKAVGTLWAIKHTPEGRFAAEDARVLQSLARFAAAASQMISALDEVTAERSVLRASEERLRLIVENARDYAIFTTDRGGRIDRWYEGAAEVFGWTAEEAIGQPAEITFTADDRAKGEPGMERQTAARDGRAPNVRWHVRKDGKRIFIDGSAFPLHSRDGALTGFLKIGQDVTERKRAEEHQKTLLAELQHRVRNIMAMIRSVARRTSETADTVEDYVQHLEGRISAMARTQALLTRDIQAEVDLENLILDELQMQAAQPGQYALTGPDISLPPKAAEVLGLAIHELATNAVKYGALMENGGRVDVRWALLHGEKTAQLSLIWSESGVRIDAEPTRRGFGTELITHRVPYELQGTGTVEFGPTGLIATLAFPLSERPSILQTDEGR